MADFLDYSRFLAPFDYWWPLRAEVATSEPLLPNFARRLELSTMRLLTLGDCDGASTPTLIVAPYAVHDAAIADFAPGHSLARALLDNGAGPLALASWKSATPDMRDYGVDRYLSDLNVAVDDLGGRVSLVGLCQGGWLAALYAARFPRKVAALVVAGAPLDLKAGESGITRALAVTPPQAIEAAIALNGGRVLGAVSLTLWMPGLNREYQAAEALQSEPDAALRAKFETWNARAVNLPGRYFVETSEWLFRENLLAESRFPALGRLCGLGDVRAPVYALAARDDAIVAPAQAVAARARCAQAQVTARVEPGGHLALFMGRKILTEVWPEIARWLEAARG